MKYIDFEELLSKPRLNRYLLACKGKTDKAMELYRSNLRLSQEMFSVLAVFEIVLRNKIDKHYRLHLQHVAGNEEWLLHAINPGGYLTSHGCNKSLESVQEAFRDLSRGSGYSHDRLVAELAFGFWRFQFASKEFMAAGSTLHAIFAERPHNTNHTNIFKKLGYINKIRNRIAHHEPVCFDITGNTISTVYLISHYNTIIELLKWMGIDTVNLLAGIDNVQREIEVISKL